MRRLPVFSVFVMIAFVIPSFALSQPIIVNHLCIDLSQIPSQWIDSARAKLNIAYGHTSHGSQLVTGMDALVAIHGNLYDFNSDGSGGAMIFHDGVLGGDVGYFPDWVNNTRSYLGTVNSDGRGSNHPDVNVIIWSWCGQASSKSGQTMVDEYLAPMTQLELDYPNVTFVYMTGHLDGGGVAGDLNINDRQIRDFCQNNNKILFDFMDIESYDPDGLMNYMQLYANDNCDYDTDGNGSRDGNWAQSWITANFGSTLAQEAAAICGDCCAHSQGLNCAMKSRAAWWLWARLAGWSGTTSVEENAKDIPRIITVSQNYPNPFNPTTTIEFTLAQNSKVKLGIYDILGREVSLLLNGEFIAGQVHQVKFDASRIPSGTYFYRIEAGNHLLVKKLVLIR